MKLLIATTVCLLSLLAAPFAHAGGECAGNSADCHTPTWGVADPVLAQTSGQNGNSGSTKKQESPPPASGAAAAQGYASSVSTMTGTTYDSQGQVQKQHANMTNSGSSSSRETGSMDILEALLILPFNPGRAAKLLLSGEQAHNAAAGLDAVTAKANKNNELMQGTQNTAANPNTNSRNNPEGAAGTNGNNTAASSGNPAASGRAGELYGQLEEKYGMGRSDFDNEVNRVKGDPEAVGSFMQEATGDKAIGKDAVNAALDAYALELGLTRAELRTSHLPAIPEFAVSAPPSGPSAPAANAPSAPKADTEAERKLASAKEKEKKESLRDKLKKALAERQSGRPTEETFEKLEPIKDQFFDKLKAEQEKELSLFEVVRAKYLEKREMLERAPGAPTQ